MSLLRAVFNFMEECPMTFIDTYITKIAGVFFARSKVLLAIAGILLLSVLIACASTDVDGGGGGGSDDTYTVGGSVTGHTGDVSLDLTYGEETETLKVAVGTDKFTFAAKLTANQSFTIAVTAPQGQTCSSSVTRGTIVNANITNISVTCVIASTHSVSGTVSGLANGETVTLTLSSTGGTVETEEVTGDGDEAVDETFAFGIEIVNGATYTVTTTSPTGKDCMVAPAGEQTIRGADVTDVAITCRILPTYSVSGSVTGTTSRNIYLVLTMFDDNAGTGATSRHVRADNTGAFSFTGIFENKFYILEATSIISGETCSAPSTTPVQITGNVTNAQITCTASTHTGFFLRVTLLSSSTQASDATVNIFVGDATITDTTVTPTHVISGSDANVLIIPNIYSNNGDGFIYDINLDANDYYEITVTSTAETCSITSGRVNGPVTVNKSSIITCQ